MSQDTLASTAPTRVWKEPSVDDVWENALAKTMHNVTILQENVDVPEGGWAKIVPNRVHPEHSVQTVLDRLD